MRSTYAAKLVVEHDPAMTDEQIEEGIGELAGATLASVPRASAVLDGIDDLELVTRRPSPPNR